MKPGPYTTIQRSASFSSRGLRRYSRNKPSINSCMARPPLPCASVICVSRNLCFRRRARSTRSNNGVGVNTFDIDYFAFLTAKRESRKKVSKLRKSQGLGRVACPRRSVECHSRSAGQAALPHPEIVFLDAPILLERFFISSLLIVFC